ncbi:MAG: four helix bundle protein, partial [Desulfoferrobacter sp.]
MDGRFLWCENLSYYAQCERVAEGFERGGRGEFHQFLSTAKASCAEVRSQLYVALDVGYLDKATFN